MFRFRSDSPQDPEGRTPNRRGGSNKRGRTTMNSMGGRGTRTTRNSNSTNQPAPNPPPSPAKSSSAPSSTGAASSSTAAGEKRKSEVTTAINAESVMPSPAKKIKTEIDVCRAPNVIEDTWFVCWQHACNKRYRDMDALKYHQNHAHRDLLLGGDHDH